jgi:hypothetical protein
VFWSAVRDTDSFSLILVVRIVKCIRWLHWFTYRLKFQLWKVIRDRGANGCIANPLVWLLLKLKPWRWSLKTYVLVHCFHLPPQQKWWACTDAFELLAESRVLGDRRAPLDCLADLLADEVISLLILLNMKSFHIQFMHWLLIAENVERFFGHSYLVWDHRFVINAVRSVRLVDGCSEGKFIDMFFHQIWRAYRAFTDWWWLFWLHCLTVLPIRGILNGSVVISSTAQGNGQFWAGNPGNTGL